MIIDQIEIKNFRSLRDVSIKCQNSTHFLGRNGSGKSSILRALEIFYTSSYVANEYDFFAKDVQNEIRIQVTYTDLRADEVATFSSYISDNKLTVTKVITSGGSKYIGTTQQIPDFVPIRNLAAVEKRTQLNALIDRNQYPGLGPRVGTATAADTLMDQYEEQHPELTQPFEKSTQFFGAKSVGTGLLDKYTKFVLIPAVRDAANEVGRKGVIQQLIDVLVSRSVNARDDVKRLNEEFEARVKEVYNTENITELSNLATLVTGILSEYAPGSALHLDFEDFSPPKITLPEALATLVEDSFKSPIGYCGHGVQRALILALLQQLSMTDTSPVSPLAESSQEQSGQEDSRPPDLILAIEEPELYLHPSRSRYLSDRLESLAQTPTNPEIVRTQVIYGTHSPYFINLNDFNRINITRKIPTAGYDAKQCQINSYSIEEAIHRLANAYGKNPEEFNSTSFMAHISPVMTSLVNEGFFADVVVVVEGLGDVGILWALQTIMGKAWDSLGIAVVAAGGKTKIDRPVVIFEGFKIPTYFIFDGDFSHQGTKAASSTAGKNRALQSLANAEQPEDFPTTQVHEHWAVFNEDIETELKLAIGEEAFNSIRKEIADDLGYSQPSLALKNIDGSSAFIELVYNKGLKLEVLEKIVHKVTLLRGG